MVILPCFTVYGPTEELSVHFSMEADHMRLQSVDSLCVVT